MVGDDLRHGFLPPVGWFVTSRKRNHYRRFLEGTRHGRLEHEEII